MLLLILIMIQSMLLWLRLIHFVKIAFQKVLYFRFFVLRIYFLIPNFVLYFVSVYPMHYWHKNYFIKLGHVYIENFHSCFIKLILFFLSSISIITNFIFSINFDLGEIDEFKSFYNIIILLIFYLIAEIKH